MDTSFLNLEFDSEHSWLTGKPYVIRFVSRTSDMHIYMYITNPENKNMSLDLYDMDESQGPIENQFLNEPRKVFLSKDRIITYNRTIYFVEYINGESNLIQVQMALNEILQLRILIINNDFTKSNDEYIDEVKMFLKSITFKKE